ncbi:MAG TPA: glycosyltransferase family 4 protein [Verrucomicrobiota bacterium]|nr:glycosyltransferase family 4 protein [Verrucomicrobiota bacterium]
MRLAFLTHEPFHPASGGGSAEAIYLVREFVRRGHELHLFCPEFDGRDAIAREFGIAIHPFTRWEMGRYTRARNLKYLLYPSALAAHVRGRLANLRGIDPAFRFDLLFAQHTISAVAAGRLRKPLGTPIVLNFLDYLTGFMETWPGWIMPRTFVRMLTRFELSLPKRYSADGILTVSVPLAERFLATGLLRERVKPIYYGYDAQLFQPLPDKSVPIADSAVPTVLMHGSFDQHHLGPVAREAVTRIAAERSDVLFRFAGRETPTLRRFAHDLRHRPQPVRIELIGFVPYSEIAQQVRVATVGLVPYEESNGTHCAFVAKAVEYLGCGVPVASTPLENLRRYFQREPAVKFSARFNGGELASEVLAWLAMPTEERRRLGHAAAVRMAKELDWPVVTGHAVDFAETVAARTSSERKIGR